MWPLETRAMRTYAKLSTLPAMPGLSGSADRSALLAGLTFVEGVAKDFDLDELRRWLDEHLIRPGRIPGVDSVNEAVVGSVRLVPHEREALPKLLAMARSRVVIALRGFSGPMKNDRFARAAIYSDRVQRTRSFRENGEPQGSIWVARPRETDNLSDIVLSLFAVDILMYRSFHERSLCVCEVCGRVSFLPNETTTRGCPEHIPGSASMSGIHPRRV